MIASTEIFGMSHIYRADQNNDSGDSQDALCAATVTDVTDVMGKRR